MVPLGLALHNKSFVQGFRLAASMAFFGWLVATWWLVPGVVRIGGASLPVAQALHLLFCLLFALPYGLAGGLYARLGWSNSISGAVCGAALWTAVIALTPHILPGNIAHSQYLNPKVIQVVEYGGLASLLFMMHLVSWSLVCALQRRRERLYALCACALAVMVCAGNWLYGSTRLEQVRQDLLTGTRIHIGWLQPDLPADRRQPEHWAAARAAVAEMTGALIARQSKLDLVVWPELPPPLSYSDAADKAAIDHLQQATDAAFLIAGFHHPHGAAHYFNRVEFIQDRRLDGLYDKRRLLPFAEYLPGERELPLLRRLFPGALRYAPGAQPQVFALRSAGGRVSLIPAICYEAVFSDLVREGVERGGQILINPVNDVWFEGTAGVHVHLALTLFRSVEFRIPVVRAANNGISLAIAATGEIDTGSLLPSRAAGIASATLAVTDTATLYRGAGQWFPWLCAILAALAAVTGIGTRVRRPAPPENGDESGTFENRPGC
jgi:apolipoprotein N-acyltransferase